MVSVRPVTHPDIDLLKTLHVLGGAAVLLFACIFWVLGYPVTALIEGTYAALVAATLAWLHVKGSGVRGIATFHIVVVFLDITTITYSLGGLVSSGAFMVWGIIAPLAAMMFLGRRAVSLTTAAYLALLTVCWWVSPSASWVKPIPAEMLAPFTAANIVGGSLLALLTLSYFLSKLRAEQHRADTLLLNMLPAEIAEVLKHQPGTIAQQHEGASILFADIVGFTPMCRGLAPTQVVDVLNDVFSRFDTLAEHYSVEKIKTIGDCYMVAAGVPREDPDHAERLAAMALDMVEAARETKVGGRSLEVRVGISTGPVVAGVIGQRRFIYDLWGDAVNLASRMESHGASGKVRVTRDTYERILHAFDCTCMGEQEIKGCGAVEVWQVLGYKPDVHRLPAAPWAAQRAG